MLTGVVTADRDPLLELRVRGPTGEECDIEALIDTGFDGWLSLSPAAIASLGLIWRRRGRAAHHLPLSVRQSEAKTVFAPPPACAAGCSPLDV
jgi:predicted aspartyl protease